MACCRLRPFFSGRLRQCCLGKEHLLLFLLVVASSVRSVRSLDVRILPKLLRSVYNPHRTDHSTQTHYTVHYWNEPLLITMDEVYVVQRTKFHSVHHQPLRACQRVHVLPAGGDEGRHRPGVSKFDEHFWSSLGLLKGHSE